MANLSDPAHIAITHGAGNIDRALSALEEVGRELRTRAKADDLATQLALSGPYVRVVAALRLAREALVTGRCGCEEKAKALGVEGAK